MYNYYCNGELKDVFNVKKKAVTTFLLFLALFAATVNLHAAISSVSGITISPANPSPGQAATITWTFVNTYGPEPENYFITIYKSCTLPATGAGNDPQTEVIVGDVCAQPTPASSCLSCVAGGCNSLGSVATAGTHTVSVPVTIPNDLIPGYTYYLDVAMASYNVYMNPDLSAQAQACCQFTVPLTAPYIKLNKVAEGTTANVGTDVLFTIYYDAGNVHNFTITDAVDSRFTILKVYSGGSWLGQNITWNSFPAYITSPQKGSVSFLAQVNGGAVSGTIIPNTAIGTSSDPATGSSTAGVAIGEPGLTIQKSASESSANAGDTITYTMQYNNLGTTLVEFQNFDDGLIPAGWTNNPLGGAWDAAPGYLEQTSTAAGYTGYMDSTMTPIHDGIYICDMLIPSTNTAHEDAVMHFIQVDSNNFYMARINASDKHLYLDKVVAGTSSIGGTSVANPHGINIVQDKWYTIKVQVCGSSIMMKIWPQGDNEYPAWDMVTTDASIPGNGIVGFQANEGPQKYDNLKIFSLTASTNPRIFDSVPVGISYQGCGGGTGCSKTGNVINWTLGSTCAGALAVSWTGVVTAACNSAITNVAGIDSDDPPPPVLSNGVIIDVNGCSPTNTPSYSPTPTLTGTPANSPTFTCTPTYTPSYTKTCTPTVTPTYTPTQSASPSPAFTATFTATNSSTWTKTATPTVTNTNTVSSDTPTYTPSVTKTFTPTQSFTGSATMTVTFTYTQTFTPTCTPSYTFTPTLTWTLSATDTESSNTPTATKTWTNTFTCTTTFTDTPTGTLTATQSDTSTSTRTATPSATPSQTPTVTDTFTDTPVFTATISATFSMTITQSSTYTVTGTYTATSTATLTYTATATLTPAPAVLSISFDTQDPAISQGGQAVMKITLSNTGSAASNAVLSETLPAQALFDTTLPANAGWTITGGTISLDAGIINGGDTKIFYFTITAAQSVASGDSITLSPVSCTYGDEVNAYNIIYSPSKTIYVGDIEIYPNPFNPSTAAGGVMKFANMPGDSIITIYTISGEAVMNFYSKQSIVPWDGKNMNEKQVSPGIYYYVIRLKNSTRVLTGKIFVIKQ